MRDLKTASSLRRIFGGLLLSICLLCTSVLGCSTARTQLADSQSGALQPENWLVSIEAAGFVPEEIEIKPGDSVTWVNEDADVHTITSWREYQDEAGTVYADIGKIWDSGDIAPGKSFTRKFNEAGTFEYLSFPMYLYTIFQSQATGVVKVERGQ